MCGLFAVCAPLVLMVLAVLMERLQTKVLRESKPAKDHPSFLP